MGLTGASGRGVWAVGSSGALACGVKKASWTVSETASPREKRPKVAAEIVPPTKLRVQNCLLSKWRA